MTCGKKRSIIRIGVGWGWGSFTNRQEIEVCIHKIWYMQFLWFSIRSYVTRIEVRYIVEWILKMINWLIYCCFTSVYAYCDKGTAGNHEVERGSIERVPASAHLLNKNFDVIFFCHPRPFALLYVLCSTTCMIKLPMNFLRHFVLYQLCFITIGPPSPLPISLNLVGKEKHDVFNIW